MFHGKISLRSVLLLLLVNSVSGLKLELMHITLTERIRSSLTLLHGFQLLVLLAAISNRNHFFHLYQQNGLFNGPEVLSSDKAKFFAKNVFENSNLNDSAISLYIFSFRNNLKLHISVTAMMVKKAVLKITVGQRSLTIVTGLVTTKKLC